MDDKQAEISLSLLYQASRDGVEPTDFHAKCDGKGATVTLVKSTEGFVFGGYSDKAWHSRNNYVTSSRAFLFSFGNPSGHAPVKPSNPSTTRPTSRN